MEGRDTSDALMSRSIRHESFKKKSSVVDKRTLRHHRRSVEWKEMRTAAQNQRRNISVMSPVTEAQAPKHNKEKNDAASRKERLMKWKKEKELKKKQQMRENSKKGTFRITHVQEETKPFSRPLIALPKVKCEVKQVSSVVSRTTRSATTQPSKSLSNNKPAKKSPQNAPVASRTRGAKKEVKKTAAPKASNEAPAVPKRSTRSSKPQVAAAPPAGRKTRGSAAAAQTVSIGRASRSQERAKESKPPIKAAACKKEPKSKANHITLTRGDLSFAPTDFKFTVPANLQGANFKPLSPVSAASFLFPGNEGKPWLSPIADRRCSTPKEKAKYDAAVIKTPGFSAVREVASSDGTESEKEAGPVQRLVRAESARRRSRRSVQATAPKDNTSSEDDKPVDKGIKRRRKSRRSAAPAPASTPAGTPAPAEEAQAKTSSTDESSETDGPQLKRSRRESKRSPALAEEETNGETKASSTDESSKTDGQSSKKSRRQSRRSVVATPKPKKEMPSDANLEEKMDEGSPAATPAPLGTPARAASVPEQEARSCDKQKDVTVPVEEEKASLQTPVVSASGRRQSRRSLATPMGKSQDSIKAFREEMSPEIPVIGARKTPQTAPVEGDTSNKENSNATGGSTVSSGASKQSDSVVFATPSTPPSVIRSRQKSRTRSLMSGSVGRKTPRNPRNSLILRTLSPEEGVEVLKHSPMVEMTRKKTPKNSRSNQVIPLPDFSDMDEVLASSTASESATSGANSSYVGDSASQESIGFVQATPDRPSKKIEPEAMEVDEQQQLSLVPVEPEPVKTSEAMAPSQSSTSCEKEPSNKVVETAEADSTTATVLVDNEQHDIPYFRRLVITETERLNTLCDKWTEKNQGLDLQEEVDGQIRSSIGCGQLLIAQRFKQFSGLVDNCEFNTGEKAIHCSDLQGFWDMVYFQVEDVNSKFEALDKLEAGGWKIEKPKPLAKKKVIKKKPVGSKPARPAAARSKFADFRAQMKKQQKKPEGEKVAIQVEASEPTEGESTKTFDAGFFRVSSPLRSPKPHCDATGSSPLFTRSRSTSRTNTPALSPLLRTVLSQSARRSSCLSPHPGRLSHNVSTPAVGSNPPDPGSSIKRKLSEDAEMQPAKPPSTLAQGKMVKSLPGDSGAVRIPTVVDQSLFEAESIFSPCAGTPGNSGPTKSTRRSLRLASVSAPSTDKPTDQDENQPPLESDDIFSKYLKPTVKSDEEPSASRRSIRQRSVSGVPHTASSAHNKSASARRRNRRSVQLTKTPGLVPLSPFCKALRLQDKENSELSSPMTPSALAVGGLDGTPTELAKTQQQVPDDLLFTPFQKMKTPSKSDSDLMAFSPLEQEESAAATSAQ